MNLEFYLEKLHASEEYKKFVKENKDAYLCSGFFVIDFEGKENKQHLDFYIPKTKKIFSFQLENNCKLVPVEIHDEKVEKISENLNFDFSEIQKLVENKMQENNIKNKIQKMLFSLQARQTTKSSTSSKQSDDSSTKDGKDFLIGTVFISGFGMVKTNINIKEMKITDFQKKSFFEMINVFRKKK